MPPAAPAANVKRSTSLSPLRSSSRRCSAQVTTTGGPDPRLAPGAAAASQSWWPGRRRDQGGRVGAGPAIRKPVGRIGLASATGSACQGSTTKRRAPIGTAGKSLGHGGDPERVQRALQVDGARRPPISAATGGETRAGTGPSPRRASASAAGRSTGDAAGGERPARTRARPRRPRAACVSGRAFRPVSLSTGRASPTASGATAVTPGTSRQLLDGGRAANGPPTTRTSRRDRQVGGPVAGVVDGGRDDRAEDAGGDRHHQHGDRSGGGRGGPPGPGQAEEGDAAAGAGGAAGPATARARGRPAARRSAAAVASSTGTLTRYGSTPAAGLSPRRRSR